MKNPTMTRYPLLIFAFPSTARPNPSSYCTQQQHPSSHGQPPLLYLHLCIPLHPPYHHHLRHVVQTEYRPIWIPHLHEGEQNNADVQSSKKRRTAKVNSDGRGGSYRRFDEDSTHAQKPLIKVYTTLYIAHLDENKGKFRQGFMQELVE
jgi:hypothetical protein